MTLYASEPRAGLEGCRIDSRKSQRTKLRRHLFIPEISTSVSSNLFKIYQPARTRLWAKAHQNIFLGPCQLLLRPWGAKTFGTATIKVAYTKIAIFYRVSKLNQYFRTECSNINLNLAGHWLLALLQPDKNVHHEDATASLNSLEKHTKCSQIQLSATITTWMSKGSRNYIHKMRKSLEKRGGCGSGWDRRSSHCGRNTVSKSNEQAVHKWSAMQQGSYLLSK